METYTISFGESYAHYAQAGAAGPAVVMLHGWAASLKQWEWLLPILAGAGYTAYVLDLPGHGQAPRLSQHHTIEDYLGYLRRWMETLKIQRPTLLGHSMGGYLSLRYALDYPKAVRGLILVDPLYGDHQFNPYHQLARQLLNSPKTLKIGETLFRHVPMWLIEASHVWNRRDVGGAPAPLRRQIALDQKRADPRIVRTLGMIQDLRPRLQQLRLPALVMWGRHDHLLLPSTFASLVELLPEAQGHCFMDVGHHPHVTHTESFVEKTLTFLKQMQDDGREAGARPPEVNLWTPHTLALMSDR